MNVFHFLVSTVEAVWTKSIRFTVFVQRVIRTLFVKPGSMNAIPLLAKTEVPVLTVRRRLHANVQVGGVVLYVRRISTNVLPIHVCQEARVLTRSTSTTAHAHWERFYPIVLLASRVPLASYLQYYQYRSASHVFPVHLTRKRLKLSVQIARQIRSVRALAAHRVSTVSVENTREPLPRSVCPVRQGIRVLDV